MTDEKDPFEAAFAAALETHAPEDDEAAAVEPVKDEPKAEPEGKPEAEEKPAEDGPKPEDAKPGEITPPEHWPEADKERFSKITDPAAREAVLEIDKNIQRAHTRRSQELAEESRIASSFRRELEPFKQEIALKGLDEIGALRAFIAEKQTIDAGLRADPKGFLLRVAKQYGVDFTAPESDKYVDPELAPIQQELATVKQEIVNERNQKVSAAISAFANEKNEDGSLKHPHFERVRGKMSILMQTDEAVDMSDAYLKATRLDSQLYEQEIQARAAEEAKKREAENRRKEDVQKALKAKTRLSGNGPARVSSAAVNSFDDAFNLAKQKLGVT